MPTMCEDCKLSIPLTQSRCEECESNYDLEEARFSCASCGYQFDQNEGVTMEQGTFIEFICIPCYFQGEGDK